MKNIVEWAGRCALAGSVAMVPLLAGACAGPAQPAEVEGTQGTVEIALTAQGQSGTLYLLRSATLDLEGPEPRELSLNGQSGVTRLELTPGSYSASLRSGWEIARRRSDGSYEPVLAVLRTPQPQALSVLEGRVVPLVLAFDVGEDAVSFGKGRLDVGVAINEAQGPTCGDGVVDAGEECDDGNEVDDDACRTSCLDAACGDGIVQTVRGEQCDDLGESESCTDACLLQIPTDLPDTPLVYVARGNASVSGPDLAAVPAGAPAILVLGVFPQRTCGASSCDYDLSPTAGPVITGYVRLGGITYPLPASVVASMRVTHGSDFFLTDRFQLAASWEQTTPAPAQFSLQAGAEARNHGAGFGHAAMPRDLTNFAALDWTFAIESTQGSNLASSSDTVWLVIDNGASCGDGVVAPGVELCDDGNLAGADGCSSTCLWELAAPAESGVAYSVYGHLGFPDVRPGTPALLTAHADAQPTCPSSPCTYAVDDLSFRVDAFTQSASSGTLTINANPYFQTVSLTESASSFGAALGGSPLPLDIALPLAPIDITSFASEQSLKLSGSSPGRIAFWHATPIECADGVCSCTPAACPASPLCGVFPDGCGDYLECGCAGGAGCTDGTCPLP